MRCNIRLLSLLSVGLITAGNLNANVVDITLGNESVAAVSGFSGTSTTTVRPGSDAVLFKMEFGERGDSPCYMKSYWRELDDHTGTSTVTHTFDRCPRSARSIKTVEVPLPSTGYAGVTALRVCNNSRSNNRLKGVTFESTGAFLAGLDDSVTVTTGGDRFRRTNCSRQSTTVSRCGAGEMVTGLDLRRKGNDIVGIALRCAAPQAEVGSQVSGDFTVYPIDFRNSHWQYLEGVHPYLNVTSAQPLDVLICSEDFPAGSPKEALVRTSLQNVLDIQETRLNFNIRTEPCTDDERTTYANQAMTADIQIQIVDFACGQDSNGNFNPLDATAGVCYLKAGQVNPWRIGDCNGWIDCRADSALLMLRRSNYPNNNRVPSIGVVTHELGHLFGQLHNYPSGDVCSGASSTGRFRKPKLFHLLPGFAKGRGDGRGVIAPNGTAATPDARFQNATAYSVAYFRYRYGLSGTIPVSAREWAIHTILVDRLASCNLPTGVTGVNPVTPQSMTSVYDAFPAQLCRAPGSIYLQDCATNALPIYRVQFSSNEEINCITQTPATLAVLVDGNVVYEEPIPGNNCRLAYYDWSSRIRIPALNWRILPDSIPIEIVINREGQSTERVPDNNSIQVQTPIQTL